MSVVFLRLLHLALHCLQVLIELLDVAIKVQSFLEDLLAARASLIKARVANYLLQEAVLCRASRSHELGEHGVELILNRRKFTNQCILLKGHILQFTHVLLISVLDLHRLSLNFFNLSQGVHEQDLILSQVFDSIIELLLIASDLLLPAFRHILQRLGLERSILGCFLVLNFLRLGDYYAAAAFLSAPTAAVAAVEAVAAPNGEAAFASSLPLEASAPKSAGFLVGWPPARSSYLSRVGPPDRFKPLMPPLLAAGLLPLASAA
eukprot:CAMPEP_0185579006 /NCGR_PEP_ID=MMETSP0434-20130131/13287_1 /TAXON_ID=626734 ORGANISM="Favella taraikaensis, Strain Fe Narragansett Bay" /NCGR_SAMPLE_ID=MMETSP0434 /ASSEMBLY_ACC=CAM_ASM_000379 /LENGTH=262 /DNA_ID=CAMNT_0028196945 /DNA_START=304 /DNA_END=1093 /DNA_ORIENTATION=+